MSRSPSDAQGPLRVLHLLAASDAGGLSRYVHDLSAAMHERGHDVRVAGARGPWHALFENAAFPWIDVPLNGGLASLWKTIRALRRHLRDNPVDVLHTHYRRSTLVARRLQSTPGDPPILYTVHLSDMPLRWPGSLWADFGDHAHVASEDARRWTVNKARMPDQRVTVIPHGLHADKWPRADQKARLAARASYGLSADDRVACYVGRLDYPKNEAWLIDLLAAARAVMPNLKLLVAGSGPGAESFGQNVSHRGVHGMVKHLGELENPLPVYQAADAFLLPSLREGFSFGCAEAMCVGVPVLRTRTAGTHELIVENVTGRSCDIDRDAFVKAGIEFLKDGEAMARMGRAAADHVRANLTFGRQLAATLALYRRLAGHAPTADQMTRSPALSAHP